MDLAALVANARAVEERTRPSRLLPMVKADAYGLGAVPIARALERVEPWGYAVATAHEGSELRAGGIRRPILVMGPQLGTLDQVARAELTPALGSEEQIGRWVGLAPGRPFHVEVDTGMSRWGVPWQEFGRAARAFHDAPGFEGVFTHFHSAWDDAVSVKEQWARFQSAVAALPRRPALVHAANSVAALSFPDTAGDLTRPGIYLYGGKAGTHQPQPVVSWRARVLATRRVAAGATVSYGATWRARKETAVATLGAGYADGLPRALSNVGAALLDGRRAPFAGRVTMDFTMVACEGWMPEVGSVATLVGSEGGETIALDDLAEAAGTISYEVLTGLGRRVKRVYR